MRHRSKKHFPKHLKNNTKRSRGGGWLTSNIKGADNYLVNLSYGDNPIFCSICKSYNFQLRNATVRKSKLQQGIVGDSILNEISLNCYFCNNCGNAIIIRDPKTKDYSNNNYSNLVTYKKASAKNIAKLNDKLNDELNEEIKDELSS